MVESKKEVNNVDVDKVELEPSDDDEVITKPEDLDEEKETPSDESSTEEEPSEATEEKEEEESTETEEGDKEKLITQIRKDSESSETEEDKGFVEPAKEESDEFEIKRLPNETPREYAFRLEVTRLKRLNRKKRGKELLGEIKTEKPSGISQAQYDNLTDEEKDLIKQYDPNELSTFEKILDVMAKKRGWVKKEELDSVTRTRESDGILDNFLESHPEYLPENDKDNVLWNRFKAEFQLYKVPENPKDLKRIFNKIHRDIFGVKSNAELKKIDAQKEKIKVVSHSGGSASRGQSSSKGEALTPDQRRHFKGFTEEELDELGL